MPNTNDSLRQCLTPNRAINYEKIFWAKQAKIGPEIRFFAILSSFVH